MTDFFFPQTIDSSMLSDFRACPQKFFRTHIQHWKSTGSNVHLHAGGAYANGLEAGRKAFYIDGKTEQEAERIASDALSEYYGDFICPDDSAKSLVRMLGALDFYFSRYPMSTDAARPMVVGDHHGIEFSFQEPLDALHPDTGNPIIFSGRADSIVNFAGGLYLEDDKTTSRLGNEWRNKWEMRGQFTGYCWMAQKAGFKVAGTLVRGISILKSGYDTAEVLTYRSQMEIDRWIYQTERDVQRMVRMYNAYKRALADENEDKANYAFDFNLDEACTMYGGCPFQSACKSSDPDRWIASGHKQEVWCPDTRQQVPLAEYKRIWLTEES